MVPTLAGGLVDEEYVRLAYEAGLNVNEVFVGGAGEEGR